MTRTRRAGVLLLGLVFGLLAACSAENVLEGSLGEFYDLDFARVRARLYSSELAIEYVADSGEVPVRITLDRELVDPKGPGDFDLGEVGDVTGTAGGWPIPQFSGGELGLDAYAPKDGALTEGLFDVTFEIGATEAALHGEFSTRLDVVE